MRHTKKILCFLLVVVILFSLTLTACDSDKISTPTNVSISEEGLITWDPVENAIAYIVLINGNSNTVTTNKYQVASVIYDFTYSIIAVDAKYNYSAPTETFKFTGTGLQAPVEDVTGVSVGIEGASSIKAGGTVQLTAVVDGAQDTSVTWAVTKGSDIVSVDSTGLVTAKEVTKESYVEITATSNANNEKSATKHLTVLYKEALTQSMLDKIASSDKVVFDGYIDISLYNFGINTSLAGTTSLNITTMMDGNRWYAEYVNSAEVKTSLYVANNNGVASSVGINFMNQETYISMTNDDGSETTWEESGLYNNFKNMSLSDFTFNEETWSWEYSGSDSNMAAKVIASANPYDFVANGFSLIIEDGEIVGIYAKSGDDYKVLAGYRAIQELYVVMTVDDDLEIPSIPQYEFDEEVHTKLQQAIDKMHSLDSYTLDFRNTMYSLYSTSYTQSGFKETVTANNYHFVPYKVSYNTSGDATVTYQTESSYGYTKISDNFYNTYYFGTEEGSEALKIYASRAYSGDMATAKPGFNFAAEIFTSYYYDSETGDTYYYVNSDMCNVATEFYNSVGNDDPLYGIFAAEYTGTSSSFTPYIVVDANGNIVTAVFYYYMVYMYGVVEITYSDFNTTTVPADVDFTDYVVRTQPTSWDQLTIIADSGYLDYTEDTEVNATEFWKTFFNNENVDVPFFNSVLGDTYGFGMTGVQAESSTGKYHWTALLYYDVPLDIDYSIESSIEKLEKYLVQCGFEANSFGEYHKDGIGIKIVDSDLDLMIYVWSDAEQAEE